MFSAVFYPYIYPAAPPSSMASPADRRLLRHKNTTNACSDATDHSSDVGSSGTNHSDSADTSPNSDSTFSEPAQRRRADAVTPARSPPLRLKRKRSRARILAATGSHESDDNPSEDPILCDQFAADDDSFAGGPPLEIKYDAYKGFWAYLQVFHEFIAEATNEPIVAAAAATPVEESTSDDVETSSRTLFSNMVRSRVAEDAAMRLLKQATAMHARVSKRASLMRRTLKATTPAHATMDFEHDGAQLLEPSLRIETELSAAHLVLCSCSYVRCAWRGLCMMLSAFMMLCAFV